jgi:hypothetical protein
MSRNFSKTRLCIFPSDKETRNEGGQAVVPYGNRLSEHATQLRRKNSQPTPTT